MKINNREISIVEYNTQKNWVEEIPDKNWLCIVVDNGKSRKYIAEVIGKIIDRNVCYVCTLGSQCETNHDLIDEEFAIREIENGYLPNHHLMTTWHEDFEEGIWFALNVAIHEDVNIEKVVVLDMSSGLENQRIISLLEKEK